MRGWTDEQVIRAASSFIEGIKPYFLKGGPKLPPEVLGERSLQMTDFILELNYRNLDLRELKKMGGW